jgi:MDMPI C-terminal domain
VIGSGEVVRIRGAEAGPTGIDDGWWLVRLGPSGLTATTEDGDGHVKADVTVEGQASDVLLVLLGRLATDSVEVRGDPAILDRFLAQATL